jgi:hypothetical protein
MFLGKENMTIKQVASPATYWCKSGHKAGEEVRFFHLSGETFPKERWGVYCEDCLIAANKLLRQMKEDGTWEIKKRQYARTFND